MTPHTEQLAQALADLSEEERADVLGQFIDDVERARIAAELQVRVDELEAEKNLAAVHELRTTIQNIWLMELSERGISVEELVSADTGRVG